MVNQIRIVFLLLFSFLMFACTQIQTSSSQSQLEQQYIFLQKLIAIDDLIEARQLNKAKKQQDLLFATTNTSQQTALQYYSHAKLAYAEQDYLNSQALLSKPSVDEYLAQADEAMTARILLLQAQLYEVNQQFLAAAKLRIYLATLITDDEQYQHNHQLIWHNLKQLNSEQLDIDKFAHEHDLQQWLQLLKLSQTSYSSLDQQSQAIELWLQSHAEHPAALYPPEDIQLFITAAENRPRKIAVILPFEGKYRHHGAAIRDGIMHAWYQSSYQPEINFYSFDDSKDFINVYYEAIFDGAEMVVGPLFKNQLEELYQLEEALPVPTIALNRLDTELLATQLPPLNLFEYSLSSEDETDSLIALARAQDKHRALIIYQQDAWATKAAQYFQQQWQAAEQQVISSVSFASTKDQSQLLQQALQTDRSQQRARELQWLTGLKLHSEPRARKDVDMIYLVSRPEAAASLRPLLSFHYAGDIPVYANSTVYRGYPNPAIDNDLNHIVFSDAPLLIEPQTELIGSYQNTPYIRVFAMGLDAFMLSERIKLFQLIDSYSLSGASGLLSLDGHRIKRKTAYGQFIRGAIQAVQPPQLAQEDKQNDDTEHRPTP